MADFDEQIGDEEKIRIASNFLTHAPPGEFNEVFNDVRALLNNDRLLKETAASAFAKYNTDQFVPATIPGVEHEVLITTHAEKSNGKFYDPRSKKSFRYDHLKNEVSEVSDDDESEKEEWRAAVDSSFESYIAKHYPDGIYSVYCKIKNDNIVVTVCIEDHKFQPKNFWNGRYRSEWCATIDSNERNAQIVGILRNQVHYYEDGNVQLVSQKECKDSIAANSETSFAKDFVELVCKAENDYQSAINENYMNMSGTTFKALRRLLPITRSKLDWNKLLGYKIGKEMAK